MDLESDGHSDLVFSDAERSAVCLFESIDQGWSRKLLDVPRSDSTALPMIVRADGTNNGVWFKHRDMWVQNEDTGGATPFHVDHRQLPGDSLPAAKEPTPAVNR